jgi:hypothetical protein
MNMLMPMTKAQKWIAFVSLLFIAVWSLWLIYMIGVYLFIY